MRHDRTGGTRVARTDQHEHFRSSFRWRYDMQPLRRVDVSERPPPGIARRESSGNPPCHSTVALLEDYIGDHRGAEFTRNFAGVREDNHDVPVLARGLRGSVHATRQNRLLALLDAEVCAELLPHLEFVTLPQRRVICEAGGMLEHVYFPISGIVSLLYESANGTSVEVAMAGNDGLVGVHLLMGGTTTTTRAVVRNSGRGYRIALGCAESEVRELPGVAATPAALCPGAERADDADRGVSMPSSPRTAVRSPGAIDARPSLLERARPDARRDGQSAGRAPGEHHGSRRKAAGGRPDSVSPRPDRGIEPPTAGRAGLRVLLGRQGRARPPVSATGQCGPSRDVDPAWIAGHGLCPQAFPARACGNTRIPC